MGRKKKCDSCNWLTTEEGVFIAQCSECGDLFPCKQNCGHLDCHSVKKRKCHKCGKRITTNSGNMFFVDDVGTNCYLVHERCKGDEAFVVFLE